MAAMTYGSLFSGIGGIDLGLDRAGMRCVWQVEKDPFCRRVLGRHWPDVPKHDDVTTFVPMDSPDLVCGGFPCQDISVAGKGAGLSGARSGLWWEMRRVIKGARPRWVLAENVSALRTRGADEVLTSLEELGYTVWPFVVGAWAVGAPHKRDRVWIVAHANGYGFKGLRGRRILDGFGAALGDDVDGCRRSSPMADTDDAGLERYWGFDCLGQGTDQRAPRSGSLAIQSQWLTEPDVGRVAHGVPARVDRLRALGNAVVPQVAEVLGRAILEIDS